MALSADGDTALIGGPAADEEDGAAWVFTRSGSTWTQQQKLTGAEHFGFSVALSGDGDTALVGGPGSTVTALFEGPDLEVGTPQRDERENERLATSASQRRQRRRVGL